MRRQTRRALECFTSFEAPEDREARLARAVRRARYTPAVRVPTIAFEQNREVLEPILRFLNERGRPPASGELPEEPLVFRG